MSNGFIDPTASRAGVPHTVLRGAMVHDAFPSFPPTKKKRKKKKKKKRKKRLWCKCSGFHRESITDPIHALRNVSPLSVRSPIYILYCV